MNTSKQIAGTPIATWLVVVFTLMGSVIPAAVAWGISQFSIADTREEQLRIRTKIEQMRDERAHSFDTIKERLSKIEQQQSRMDERSRSLKGQITEMKQQLNRIEDYLRRSRDNKDPHK